MRQAVDQTEAGRGREVRDFFIVLRILVLGAFHCNYE